MVDKRLLIDPSELMMKPRNPAILRVSKDGVETLIYGTVESSGTTGSNLPFRLFNDRGQKICGGNYSISLLEAALGSGGFEANCFEGSLGFNGEISIKRIALRHMSGNTTLAIGKGEASDGSKIGMLLGIPVTRFDEYKDLLE